MSQKTFDITQLSGDLIDLLSDIQIGTEVPLTRQGTPLAKVTPLSTEQPVTPKIGLNYGAMVMSDDFDEPLQPWFLGTIMKALLNTHKFIWWDSQPEQRSTDCCIQILRKSEISHSMSILSDINIASISEWIAIDWIRDRSAILQFVAQQDTWIIIRIWANKLILYNIIPALLKFKF